MVDTTRRVALLGNEWGDPDDPRGDRQGFREDARLLSSGQMNKIVIPWSFAIDPDIEKQLRYQSTFEVLVTKEKRIRFVFHCEDFRSSSTAPAEWVPYVVDKYAQPVILDGKTARVQLLVAAIKPYGGEGLPLSGWRLWRHPEQHVSGALLSRWQYVYQSE